MFYKWLLWHEDTMESKDHELINETTYELCAYAYLKENLI